MCVKGLGVRHRTPVKKPERRRYDPFQAPDMSPLAWMGTLAATFVLGGLC